MSAPLTPFDADGGYAPEPLWVGIVNVLGFAVVVVLLVVIWWAAEPDCTSPKDRAPVAGVRR